MIGSGGLAAEAPGGEVEGGVWKCRLGVEEEAVWSVGQIRSCSAQKPALETAARTGELLRHAARTVHRKVKHQPR